MEAMSDFLVQMNSFNMIVMFFFGLGAVVGIGLLVWLIKVLCGLVKGR